MHRAASQERLCAYLQTLSAQKQAELLDEIAFGRLVDPACQMRQVIKDELQRLLWSSGSQVARLGNPSRMFFMPIEPFLVDGEPDRAAGQIARASLNAIWTWIGRNLLPDVTKAYCASIVSAARMSDPEACHRLAHEFQDKVIEYAHPALAKRRRQEIVMDRLTEYFGPHGTFEDLVRIVHVLEARALPRQVAEQNLKH